MWLVTGASKKALVRLAELYVLWATIIVTLSEVADSLEREPLPLELLSNISWLWRPTISRVGRQAINSETQKGGPMQLVCESAGAPVYQGTFPVGWGNYEFLCSLELTVPSSSAGLKQLIFQALGVLPEYQPTAIIGLKSTLTCSHSVHEQ